jgi:RNA polymerase-binding transcription factor DksA
MATKKKTASKGPAKKAAPTKKTVKAPKNVAPKKTAKKATPAKKAAPAKAAKKNVTKKAAPAKKAAVKKAAPSKKSAPNKAVAKKAAPAKKAVAKKVAPNKKSVTTKTKATNVKKETKKSTAKAAAPAKKTTAKKAEPAKKAVAKKAAAPAKKETVAKKPAAKPAAPAKKETASKAASAKKAAAAKAATVAKTVKAAPIPTEKPKPTRRNARDENKQQVIVAHRRLENKSKQAEKAGKTMISYQPEFTRSILDAPVEQQGPVYRYSDEELNEFRVLITGRLEAARKELAYLQGLITRKDEAGTEDTENRYMNMEDGSGAMEREQLAQLASRQIQFINHLEKAMMRIENKTYGICRVTGKLIDKARLRAVPHATLSIEAKKMMSSK